MKTNITPSKIQAELNKYDKARLRMQRYESRLNAYFKSKIINDVGKHNLSPSHNKTLFEVSFEDDDIALSNLAGDGLCLMFGVYGMSVNTAIRKIKEDGYIYISKITEIDLSY